jgi:hypothetical protein
MHCIKLPGRRPAARDFDRQVAEFQVRAAVLNGFTALGIPVTETAGCVRPGKGEPRPSGRQRNRVRQARPQFTQVAPPSGGRRHRLQ